MEQQDEIYRKLEIEASKNYILPANNFLGVKEGQNPLLLGMRAYIYHKMIETNIANLEMMVLYPLSKQK